MHASSPYRRLQRGWKRVAVFALVLVASLFALALVRFNIPPERFSLLAGIQQGLGLNQPPPSGGGEDLVVIGHRGSGVGIENTRQAIDGGIDAGADWIEVDIRKSGADLILFHDETIDKKEIAELSIDKLRAIQGTDAGPGSALTLEELFVHYPSSEVGRRWLLDVKSVQISEEVLGVLEAAGFNNAEHRDRIVIQGTWDIIEEYANCGYPLAYVAGWSEGWNKYRYLFGNSFIVERCVKLEDLGGDLKYLTLPVAFLNRPLIETVEERVKGIRVWTYGGETPLSWKKSIAYGAHGIIADRVKEAKELPGH